MNSSDLFDLVFQMLGNVFLLWRKERDMKRVAVSIRVIKYCETVTLLGRRRLLNDLDRGKRHSQPCSRKGSSVFQENVS